MLLEIPAKSQKNAKIMPDFFKKCHLNSKNAFVLFQTKRTNSYIICSYQQQVILNNSLYLASPSPTPSWLSERKSYPLAIYAFFPLVLVRHVTETDNLHTQVTHYKYTTNTSNTTHKQSKQTENNQNCETLGLFIFLSAEIWITVMKND